MLGAISWVYGKLNAALNGRKAVFDEKGLTIDSLGKLLQSSFGKS